MERLKKVKNELINYSLINLIIAINITIASFAHIPFGDFKGFFLYFFYFLAVQITLFGFVYLLTINKYVFYTLFPFTFIASSTLAFWVYAQDLSINYGLIESVIESNVDIAVDFISPSFLFYFIWIIISTFLCVKLYKNLEGSRVKSLLFPIAILCVLCFFVGQHLKRDVFTSKLPFNIISSLKKYSQKSTISYNRTFNDTMTKSIDSIDIVFVLGESVRADHLGLNGYKRQTTPLLNLQQNLISYSNIYTPLTYTAVSVPQILTNQSISDVSTKSHTILYSILNKLNINTTWIGNQSLEKSYETMIKENKNIYLIDALHSVLSFKKHKDEELIKVFDGISRGSSLNFTTIHMIGSHWYYDSRYSEKHKIFTPTTKGKFIKSSTKEELINSYDNTLLYLDWFLNTIIEKLKQSKTPTLLIYISDHGEILGENNQWLHAQKNKASTNPAMLVWYSDSFNAKLPEKIEALIKNKNQENNTDLIFNSILHLLKVEGFPYNLNNSIFIQNQNNK
jgi:lipid A ethanolaminephosphotransferase